MNENLGHNRTEETEVRIASISEANETTSLEDFTWTVGVNVGICHEVLPGGQEGMGLKWTRSCGDRSGSEN